MPSKRKPLHSPPTQMKFRGGFEPVRNETKGTRPTATPTTVQEVITKMILHVCKKTIFFDTNIKVALYLGSLFLISLIGDFIPFPKSYFSRSDNLFNVYFVKLGWAWTIMFSIPFLTMTSYTICCGDFQRLLKNHLPRLVIATFFWFAWTKSFNLVEQAFGRCSTSGFSSKSSCLKMGHLWNGFDISGHAFILIYSSLVLIEEARPITNWDNIKEHIRNELFNRKTPELANQGTNPLKNLKNNEIENLQYLYEKFTPSIRVLFVGMTALQLLWDIMLVCTMLYYHNMAEKMLSGIVAVLTWYFTYRFWYPSQSILPDVAGKGIFQYQKDVKVDQIPLRRHPSLVNSNTRQSNVPKFMGMPLYSPGTATRLPQQQSNTTPTAGPSGGLGAEFVPTSSRF